MPSFAGAGDPWILARPDYAWSFPRDHWAHPGYRSEWWYFTGHLLTDEPKPRRLAYQFTVFRVGLEAGESRLDSGWAARDVLMGHAALMDLDRGWHRFSELLYRAVPLLGGFPEMPAIGSVHANPDSPRGRLAWSRAPAGTDSTWTLDWNGSGFAFRARDDVAGVTFDLVTTPERPLVLEGPNGFSDKGGEEGAASQYYSFTRLATEGTVVLDGKPVRVHGRTWMDKEFGSGVLGSRQVGWDWFSLQLQDGRDLMLYLMRDRDGGAGLARGTIVEADGTVRYLEARDFSVTAKGSWKSPVSHAEYPARWTVRLERESTPVTLEVVPELADQENLGKLMGGVSYWEGAVEVLGTHGERVGEGFVELTGYGTGNRPGL
jgi:predicted secreted hydrolase